MVEVNGELVRACGTRLERNMRVETEKLSCPGRAARGVRPYPRQSLLYCTVCDNNNQNCTVHNTTALLKVEHQSIPYRQKPYEKDETNPFYRYDPDQCILCGRCVEACQNVQVNETLRSTGKLSIRACCGMVAPPSATPAVSPAAIASRSAPAMR